MAGKNDLDTKGLEAVKFGEEIRKSEFCLRPGSTFINNGSYGTVPRRVLDVQKRLVCNLTSLCVYVVCVCVCVCVLGGRGAGAGRIAKRSRIVFSHCGNWSFCRFPCNLGIFLKPISTGLGADGRALPLFGS